MNNLKQCTQATPATDQLSASSVNTNTSPATVPQTTPATVPKKTPATMPQPTPPTVPETTPATVPQTTPATVPQTTPSTVPLTIPAGTGATGQPVEEPPQPVCDYDSLELSRIV